MLLDLQLTELDGWMVVAPVGELDLASVPRVRQAVVGVVADGTAHLVLDLSGVDFLDSIGLGLVVAIAKRARSHDGELRVAGVRDRLWSLFELVGLDEQYERFADASSAVAGVERSGSGSRG